MSNKNIAKLMEIRGLSENQIRTELASKKSLKDNVNDLLDERDVWVSFADILKAAKLYSFNKGEDITERGLKIMLARMRDTAEIFRSDNSGYWWTTITSSATTLPTTAIPADWTPTKKVNKSTNSLGIRGKRATSPDKFYTTVLNSLARGDNVRETTLVMARTEYANTLSLQFGGKVSIQDIERWLQFGENQKLAVKSTSDAVTLSDDEDSEVDEMLKNAALLESDDDDSEEVDDSEDSE